MSVFYGYYYMWHTVIMGAFNEMTSLTKMTSTMAHKIMFYSRCFASARIDRGYGPVLFVFIMFKKVKRYVLNTFNFKH